MPAGTSVPDESLERREARAVPECRESRPKAEEWVAY
jgi:hypothetical protein